ncbi:hypothetical protein [Leifsonia sp. P73]|uniref:hypothetical protein n=1 Tax=Leifsonia sp. P73 TaxID=3423959 RepID=UPI003DA1D1AF
MGRQHRLPDSDRQHRLRLRRCCRSGHRCRDGGAGTGTGGGGFGGGFGGGGFGGGTGGGGAFAGARRAATQTTADIALHAPVTLWIIVGAVALAILGGLIAGAIGGWRASRLRPAAALRSVA